MRDPTVTVARPARVQAKGEPAAIVPATTQIPQAVIPTEIRYATAVSISVPLSMGRELLILVVEDQEMQAAPEQAKCFRFSALCGAIRHVGPQAVCRELPCADVLRARMASDQTDILDRAKLGS